MNSTATTVLSLGVLPEYPSRLSCISFLLKTSSHSASVWDSNGTSGNDRSFQSVSGDTFHWPPSVPYSLFLGQWAEFSISHLWDSHNCLPHCYLPSRHFILEACQMNAGLICLTPCLWPSYKCLLPSYFLGTLNWLNIHAQIAHANSSSVRSTVDYAS